MNIVIAGGGTGGHVFPALAIAKGLKDSVTGTKITFVGTARGIEANIIPKAGYDIRFIQSEGLVGRGFSRTVLSAVKVPVSLRESQKILKEEKPDIVIGVGGYSSGPVVLCAALMGIPTMIHEQNTLPGLTNRILARFVDTIAVTYQESLKSFPAHKTYLTGNPVREEIVSGDRERGYEVFSLRKDLFTIFIFGGSRGAHHINSAVTEALQYLEPLKEKIQFLHQTGEQDFDSVRNTYREMGFHGTIVPFSHDMADAYAVADLVIARAGATTLAELTACGKAALLVPYPHAAGNHQEVNARKLWDMGAAQLILDKDLDGMSLAEAIQFLFEDTDVISEMERISRSLGNRDATKKVVELALGLMRRKGESGAPRSTQRRQMI